MSVDACHDNVGRHCLEVLRKVTGGKQEEEEELEGEEIEIPTRKT